jgi:malonyl-CoA O-methyltransferase
MSLRTDFSRSASRYDEAAVLSRESGQRMAERLDLVKLEPRRIADVGCATGDGLRELQQRYPKAQALAIDYARPMLVQVRSRNSFWQRLRGQSPLLVNGDVNALPLAGDSLGLVWSNLMLQWLDDPLPALKELHRVLEVDGLLMFATLGPDTIKELRAAAAKVGAGDTARRFVDMHDLGDMLVGAGFADPVMDMELIRFSYRNPRQFLADQRHLGVRDALLGTNSWRDWRRMFAAATDADGALELSIELVFGHAWKAAARQAADGRSVIRFHSR